MWGPLLTVWKLLSRIFHYPSPRLSTLKKSSSLLYRRAESFTVLADQSWATAAMVSSNEFSESLSNDKCISVEKVCFPASPRQSRCFSTTGNNSATDFFTADASFHKPSLKATRVSLPSAASLNSAAWFQTFVVPYTSHCMVWSSRSFSSTSPRSFAIFSLSSNTSKAWRPLLEHEPAQKVFSDLLTC